MFDSKDPEKIYPIKQIVQLSKVYKIDPKHFAIAGGGVEVKLQDSKQNVTKLKMAEPSTWENNGVTLKELGELSKSNLPLAVHITHFTLCRSSYAPIPPKFLGEITFDELKKVAHPNFLSQLILCKETRLCFPKHLIEGFIRDMGKSFLEIPNILLQPLDFKEAIASSKYKTQPPAEGFWEESYVNKDIYEFATKLREDGSLDAKKLGELQQKILNEKIIKGTDKINEAHRYPVPELKPWENQDKFLACLAALEELAYYEPEQIKLLFTQVFSSEILNKLLNFNLVKDGDRGAAPPRLPVPEVYKQGLGNQTFSITFPDEQGKLVKIAWTEALKWYVRDYNILPSQEFLINFQKLLKACQTFYLPAAHSLAKEFAVLEPKPSSSGPHK